MSAWTNDAEVARRNGWSVGTRLAGDEGYGETVIEITAIGERNVLAKRMSHKGKPADEYESMWTFSCRDWVALTTQRVREVNESITETTHEAGKR